MGCRFVTISGEDQSQSLGAFNFAVYDGEEVGGGSNNFLGCVSNSEFWKQETSNDIGFLANRIASALLLAFTVLATIICTCLQCFSKHGKSHLWNVMRVLYLGAMVSQGAMYIVFASDLCTGGDGTEQLCFVGTTGIVGMFNFVLLFGMVVATFNSLPPRNPVFQCWGSDADYESDDDGSTEEEEDEVMRKFKSFGEAGHSASISAVENDSVSLFGGSRMSKKSRRSVRSKTLDDEDAVSKAEKGLSSAGSGRQSIGSTGKKDSGSVVSSKSLKSSASEKSKKPVPGVTAVPTADSASVSSGKSGRSASKFMPFVSKYMSKDSKSGDNESVASGRSKMSSGSNIDEMHTDSLLSKSSNFSTKSQEMANFISQLIEMTELNEGGRRVKADEQENKVQIVDEYPKEEGKEIESSPSSDVVKIRTEYYDLGSRTTKEITHRDGSCTIVTTILGDTAIVQPKQAVDAPIQVAASAGSISDSSKYKVLKTMSSEDTSTILKQKAVGQGEFAL
ncbi:unnamed protein product [Pseudo-nitzschia multistriata]|uniref:Uncharacterized protein n=1 Tax=Pseudo-nitzschia multistriata TaxID=183589 RepID=A0A448YYB7_9STRA|nr:unnamed protein product [Pseudo-nitzschia multistriata]